MQGVLCLYHTGMDLVLVQVILHQCPLAVVLHNLLLLARMVRFYLVLLGIMVLLLRQEAIVMGHLWEKLQLLASTTEEKAGVILEVYNLKNWHHPLSGKAK